MREKTYFRGIQASLVSRIENYLRSIKSLKPDSHYKIVLGGGSTLSKVEAPSVYYAELNEPLFKLEAYVKKITNPILHWGCPIFSERELDHRPAAKSGQANVFIAFLKPRWVYEYRLGPEKTHVDAQFYVMRVLYLSIGSKNIVPFLGLLRDDDGRITAYLTESLSKGNLRFVMDQAIDQKENISMERREKWCRRIVRGVLEIHRSTFVLGTLGCSLTTCVSINENDNAIINVHLLANFAADVSSSCVLPPEYHPPPLSRTVFTALPQTDIYQLGLLLWRIVGHKLHGNNAEFCMRACCTTPKGKLCTHLHTYGIELPMPKDMYPEYLRDIIAACRTRDPNNRPGAQQLLDMFPSSLNVEGTPTTQEAPCKMYLMRPEQYQGDYDLYSWNCDICGLYTHHHYFHCGICSSDDWDVCPSCFNAGAHCLEKEHQLQEFFTNFKPGKWYGSPGVDGSRAVFAL